MDVAIARDGFDLAGDLLMPTGEPVCGVVMLGGSGGSDRANGGYFEPIRSHLVERGIAVLSYDKRGVGSSGGAWVDATLGDFADDAVAALRRLRDALPTSVPLSLYGHSEGGWVALITAARDPGLVDRLVTTSCPAITPGAQDRYAVQNEMAGAPDAEAVLDAYDRLLSAPDHSTAADLLRAVPRLGELFGPLSEREWRFLCRKKDYDPMQDARAITRPWLALYGAADPLIPVAETMSAFSGLATAEAFPGADHRIQVEGRLATGFLEAVTDWLTPAS